MQELTIIAVFTGLWFVLNWMFIRRSTSVLRKWAADHGYVILRSEISLGAPLCAGVLSLWSSARRQLEYSVTLQERAGVKHSAVVSCCGFVRGAFLTEEVTVTEDDETAA